MNPIGYLLTMKIRSDPTIQLNHWMIDARNRIQEKRSEPTSTLWALLSFFTNKPQSWLVAHPEFHISYSIARMLNCAIDKLVEGYPLAYIIHRQAFYGLEFFINPSVLIPRPETELMVETAIAWLRANPNRRVAAEIGIGSGCVSISLAHHINDLSIIASDISWSALQVAKKNIANYDLCNQIHLIQCDFLSGVFDKFDLICANLPYISSKELQHMEVSRFEPKIALDGGVDGLRVISNFLVNSPRWLKTDGILLLEIESHQEKSLLSQANSAFAQKSIRVLRDLAKFPRLVVVENLPL